MITNSPELVLPAGNFEKLQIAFQYGADCVYVGAQLFNLRLGAKNFEVDELEECVKFAHSLNKKIFLLCNTYPHTSSFEQLEMFLKSIITFSFDGIIIADVGVFKLVRTISDSIPIHISTQANVTNLSAVQFWEELGVKRIVLARELSIDEIKNIRENTSIEIETFIHGAMCMSISGRCLMSNVLSGRDANQGECSQPCRWEYSVIEQSRPNTKIDIEVEKDFSYIFSSKDLCLAGNIKELIQSGINAFKIEGRMKSIYYVANTARVYRYLINTHMKGELPDIEWCIKELDSFSHREYDTGFFFKNRSGVTSLQTKESYISNHRLLGLITDKESEANVYKLKLFNPIRSSFPIEIITPQKKNITLQSYTLLNTNKQLTDLLPHQKTGYLVCQEELQKGYILRTKIE